MSEFPIRVLSEQTGVPATTLRAWERRYGLLKPKRTPKGHRLYTRDDVEMVRQVVSLLEDDYTISKAINAIRLGEARETVPETAPSHWIGIRKRFSRAIETFDENLLDTAYNEALSLYPIDIVTINLIRPLLKQLGKEWEKRPAGIAEEHFFTAYLRNKIGARMHHSAGRNQGKRLLVACLPGEHHELGLLLFSLSAMTRGYRILYLGADLPLEQVRLVAETVDVQGILLSGSTQNFSEEIHQQVAALADSLDVPVMLGGSVSDEIQDEYAGSKVLLLSSDYATALGRMEMLIPAYGV